jgi:hypothetical protein
MNDRRKFLVSAAAAVAALVGGAIGGVGPLVAAEQRTWYVRYRRNGGRWYGVGPYTWAEACRVEGSYLRAGYQTYISAR